jgi:mono/diheme cytochrome c family protein
VGAASTVQAQSPPALDPVSAAFVAGDCHRCHTVPSVGDAARLDSCKVCHVWIKAVSADPAKREKAKQVFPLWDRYEKNVATYLEVPSLDAAMARLDPEWVRGYLRDPHDLRPHLSETMPRFDLDPAEVDTIVGAFAKARVKVPGSPEPAKSRVAEGEKVFGAKGCGSCHAFGGRASGAIAMAPDLANTRDRMDPDVVYAWIADPKAVSAAATMPDFGLTDAEVLAVRDYVLLADPKWKPAPKVTADPVATKDPVTWAQVEERVFGKICVHCHMNPDLNQGRAGPGNSGGFGWPATGIELQTYEGVAAAADRIPDAILRRRHEAPRDAVAPGQAPAPLTRPARPGMPLGLPPLSDEEISLVLGWIDQGMPR